MVVDFAIEDDDGIAVLADHRLVARKEIDDPQADGAKRNVCCFVDSLRVWSTMHQRPGGVANVVCVGDSIDVSETGNAAHVYAPSKKMFLAPREQQIFDRYCASEAFQSSFSFPCPPVLRFRI